MTKIEKFCKQVYKKMSLGRIMCEPRNFDTYKGITGEDIHQMEAGFFELTLCTKFLEEFPVKLFNWKNEIDRYFSEFKGAWKYYAICQRRDLINEYGGDEEDYDDDGNIKPAPEKRLVGYSLPFELFPEEIRDLVCDIDIDDVKHFWTWILLDGNIDFIEMFKEISGKEIPTYHMDEDGVLVKTTEKERKLHRDIEKLKADELCQILHRIFERFIDIRDAINDLKNEPMNDYKEEFEIIRTLIQKLIDMDIFDK